MADPIDQRPTSTDPNANAPVSGNDQAQPAGSDADAAPPAETGAPAQPVGWHEPPRATDDSRPVLAQNWFKPENAAEIPDEAAPPTGAPTAEAPAAPAPATPERSGAWYTPPSAQLDALLSGAAASIVERHDPAPLPAGSAPSESSVSEPAQPDDATRWQEVSDTQVQPAVTDEPAPEAESTPTGDATPAQGVSGLSPAETAFLAQQRDSSAGQGISSLAAAPEQPAAEAAGPAEPAEPDAPADTGPAAEAAAPAAEATAEPAPSRFEEVEDKVSALRAQYQAGAITRDQLQSELRRLMILDDEGHWWMLGLESNRWYRYDGKNWVEMTPPGYRERVKGERIRTETGLQQVVVDETMDAPQRPQADDATSTSFGDDEDMPLPKRIPQDDPAATLVSPGSPFLEPTRRGDAPTVEQMEGVTVEDIPQRPGEQVTMPTRPVTDSEQATMPSMAVGAGAAEQGGLGAIPVPAGAGTPPERGIEQPGPRQPAAPERPRYRLGEFPQPDYSAALGSGRNRNTYLKWGIRIAAFTVIGGMVLTLLVLLAMVGYYFNKVNQYQGAVDTLAERAADFETTLILNSSGETLAEFSDPETGPRREVPLGQISPWLIHATIATENETFYTDPGFSVLAIVRAAIQNVREGATVSGASTITQQLARALVLETEFASQRTTERKIVEVIVASEIKRKYTKNEILEIYLNEIFYGNRAYGIEAAAQTYFGIPASDLNPAQAAFLAGLPQSPATYDPVVNREAATARMHTVLRLMSEANGTGCIAIQHADQSQWAVPDGGSLCVRAQEQPDGGIVYFYQQPGSPEWVEMTLDIARVEIAPFTPPTNEFIHPHFVNYVWQQLEEEYGPQRIYSAGFRVTTTLNEPLQLAAEQAVTERINTLRTQGIDVENASVVVIRPADGAVEAMVGSADFNNEEIDGQVNVAFTAQQPGSSIKPFVYLTAFQPNDQGQYWTPATVIWDVYTDFGGYVPQNFDRRYHGPKTARESLVNSLNVPAVKTLNYAGLLRFTQTAQDVGLRFPLGNPVERNAGLPTALGAVEVRLFDMVAAYAMLGNGGVRMEPYAITEITDSRGNVVFQVQDQPTGTQLVKPELAYLLTDILSDSVTRQQQFAGITALDLNNGRPAAVKTGTSNDSRDIWTIGYTPQYAVGVWMGNTDNRPMYTIYGSTGAAPLWKQVMEAAHANQPVLPFTPPPGMIEMEVCRDSGTLPTAECAGRTYNELFAQSQPPPSQEESIYQTMQVDDYTGKLVNEFCPDDVVTRTFLDLDDPAAYNWINTEAAGNAWAAERGLELPVQPPPTEACSPNDPRPTLIISFPEPNRSYEGVLPIRGQIVMPDFNRYEVRFAEGHGPDVVFSQPVLVDQTQWSQPDSILHQIDTRSLANGPYTIQVVAIDNLGRSISEEIPITVNNQVIPTPTVAPTLTLPPTGPTPVPTLDVPPSPTLAPSLTPQP